MRILTLSTSILALVLCESSALAQGTGQSAGSTSGAPEGTSETVAAEVTRDLVENGVASGPTDRLLASNPAPTIQLLASAGEKTASLTWSFRLSPGTNQRLSYTQFSLSVETSVDDPAGDTELFGLRGFAGGTEVTLNLFHMFGNMPAIPEAELRADEAAIQLASRNCHEDDKIPPARRAEICDEDQADYPGISAAIERHNRPALAAHIQRHFPTAFPFLGVEVGGNQDNYNYLNRTAFSIGKVSHFGYGATLYGGLLFTRSLTSLTGSFTYSRRYQARRSITLCQGINPTQQQCLTGADGPPGVERQAIAAIELRHAWGGRDGSLPRFAIAPELSYDFNNHSYAIDVPIYLAQASNGQLRGGVRLGYVNQPDGNGGRNGDFSLGVFVGVPFTLFR
jgi:hypothetical protein